MKKKNIKGFTLVELLVVIAILAILATVTVVGYISFTNKAKESNDISLITQMNTVLQAEEATEGKADTLSIAIEWLKEAGLDVEKLTPTSDGYKYIWDKESNRFYLLNDKGEVVSPEDDEITNGIEIVHNNEQLNASNYGVYLASDYSGESNEIELSKAKSIEIGTNSINSLSIIDSESNNNIYVSGNLDNLDLNVPNASVDLYGDITFVNASVASNSLHVYGHVQELTMNQGRVVAEANSTINTINAGESATNVVVESNSSSAVIGAIYDPNDRIENKVNNVEVVKEKVEGFAGGVGTENSPYLISNASEFANIVNKNKLYYFEFINDIDLNEDSFSNFAYDSESIKGYINGNNYKLIMPNINKTQLLFEENNGDFSVKNLTLVEGGYCVGLLDYAGNGYTVNFSNINVINSENISITIADTYYGPFISQTYCGGNITLENCNNYANYSVKGTYWGLFIANYISGNPNKHIVNFINCNNYGSVSGINIGLFAGQIAAEEENGSIVLIEKDTINYDDVEVGKNYVSISNCSNGGVLLGSNSVGFFGIASAGQQNIANELNAIVANTNVSGTMLILEELNATLNCENGNLVVDGFTDNNYIIRTKSSVTFKNGSGYVVIEQKENPIFIEKMLWDIDYSLEYSQITSEEYTSVDG